MTGWLAALGTRLGLGPRMPERPVLVGGSPKSGTTAIAGLLGVATGSRVASDPFHELDRRGVDFRDALYEGRIQLAPLMDEHVDAFAGEIIKDPNFAFFVDPLLARFPESPFIFIVRDPRANIRSILNRLEIAGDADPAVVEARTPELPDAWRRVIAGRTPDVAGGDFIERLAHRWNAAADAYLARADRLTLVTYEAFDHDKEGVIAGLAAEVGLARERPLGAAVDRQFQPRGTRGVDWKEFFGPANLATIDRICRDRMVRLGYTPGARGAAPDAG